MAIKYPPYVGGYGKIATLFRAIKDAAVQPKFTNNFMQTALALKSTSFRAMIPLMKRLGFIDSANVPTLAYKAFRDEARSGAVMADRLRVAYEDLFSANEYAYKLKKPELEAKLKSLTGAGSDDKNVPLVASTFLELSKLATFDGEASKAPKSTETQAQEAPKDKDVASQAPSGHHAAKLGISYTINLNLPATTEIQVFNAIFKSLKEHILHEG